MQIINPYFKILVSFPSTRPLNENCVDPEGLPGINAYISYSMMGLYEIYIGLKGTYK